MVWRGPSIRPRAPQQSDYFGVSVRNPQHVRLRVGVRGLRLCQQGRLNSEAQPRPGEVEPAQRLTNCGNEFLQQGSYSPIDLLENWSDLIDGLSGGIVKFPIFWRGRPIQSRYLTNSSLLDFVGFPVRTSAEANETDFACWIFVGFRAAMNMCSHPDDQGKSALTCSFASWAVTGSNRRPCVVRLRRFN